MLNNQKRSQIGVIGSAGKDDYGQTGGANDLMLTAAEKVGRLLAKADAIVVTGGKDGIMAAAAAGAKKEGGLTIGVVKGQDRFSANKYTDIEVLSGMSADGLDELILVLMCDALIVIGGGAGTLQEITIAYRNKKSIIALNNSGGWAAKLAGKYLDEREKICIKVAATPEEAVNLALAEIK